MFATSRRPSAVAVAIGALVFGMTVFGSLGSFGSVSATDTKVKSTDPPPVELVLFWGDGCPHCAAEKEFLGGLQDDYPELVITLYEVWNSEANRQLFADTADRMGF